MRWTAWAGVAALTAAASASVAWTFGDSPSRTTTARAGEGSSRIAAPGRVEGASETLELGTAVAGRLAGVLVHEGEWVHRGQLLASIDCQELVARVDGLRATRTALEATQARIRRGGRPDARAQAGARLDAALARLDKARTDRQRAAQLWADAVISREEFERATSTLRVGEAEEAEAREAVSVIAADPLPEELRELDARVKAASAEIASAEALLAHCDMRAPIDGEVLRIEQHVGEMVSPSSTAPIVVLADTRRLRVRVELDEHDIHRVATGDAATIETPAGDVHLAGLVAWVGRRMGRRTVLSGDPADKSDRDVLEAIVDLGEADRRLPVGLRVVAILDGRKRSRADR